MEIEVCYDVHKRLPLFTKLYDSKLFHAITLFIMIHFNIIFHLRQGLCVIQASD
jgi:hypothetical protein